MANCKIEPIDPRGLPASDGCRLWVYFIREEDDGPIKIGYAHRVVDRLVGAQVGNCRVLRLIGVIRVREKFSDWERGCRTPTAKELEQDLHKRFAKARIRGEWFAPTEELVEFIGKLNRPFHCIEHGSALP